MASDVRDPISLASRPHPVTPALLAYAQTVLADYRKWQNGQPDAKHPGAAAVILAEGIIGG